MIQRVANLREKMKAEGITSFLITSPYNLRYLTGFTGTTGLALIGLEEAFFITDFRYTEQAAKQCVGYDVVKNVGPILEVVAELVESKGLENLAFEESFVPFKQYVELETLLEVDLVPVSGMIEELREVKDEAEIKIVEKACEIADKAFSHILTYIKPGMTEIQVANELDLKLR